MMMIRRTSDVRAASSGTALQFSDLLLSDAVLRGLSEGVARAEQPSPVQLTAIPLARLGVDLIAQAKSGTGKTLVYVITALETLLQHCGGDAQPSSPLVLVVAPTHELALQISDVLRRVGQFVAALACVTVLGGVPIASDVAALAHGCSVVVGTPGRIQDLLCKQRALNVSALRLLVLDEADRLFDQQFLAPIKEIVARLPPTRQTLAFSATYSDASVARLTAVMREPQRVTLSSGSPNLIGVRQVRVRVKASDDEFAARLDTLERWLQRLPFQQCVVFCSSYTRAQRVAQHACDAGWRAASIAGGLSQRDRERTMNAFRNGALNVLVSTDLTARGVDVDLINLVVQFDAPTNVATYFHRVGRAGRFGTYGASLLFERDPDDAAVATLVAALATQFRVDVAWLDDNVASLPDDFLCGAAPLEQAQPEQPSKIDYGFDDDDDNDDEGTVAMTSPVSQPAESASVASIPAAQPFSIESAVGSLQPTRAAVGENCTVRWPDDGLWYDARVVGRADDDDNVRLVVFDDFAEQVHRAACEDIRARDAASLLFVLRGSDAESIAAFVRAKLAHGGVLCHEPESARTAVSLGRSPVILVGADLPQTALLAKHARARAYQVFVQHFADPDPFTLADALALEDEVEDEDQPLKRARVISVAECKPQSTLFVYESGLNETPWAW